MKNAYLKQKGFTLVEILIVVVILAILASLILPRLLSQPERAVIAEAQQMLGTLRRAQQTRMDVTGSSSYLSISCASANCTDSNLSVLGINSINNSKFGYSCSGTSCTATRLSGSYANANVTLSDSGSFACGGAGNTVYRLADSGDAQKGCAL